MKNLISILLFVAISSIVKAQAPVDPYFERHIFVVVEQQAYFAGGDENFAKVINNTINFPKKFGVDNKGYHYTVKLKVRCLVSPEGKVLHVQSTYVEKNKLAEKDQYYVQNQIAYLFVNLPKILFNPFKLNGHKTYGVYESVVTLSNPGKQAPLLAGVEIKPDKSFYKEPVAVHFMEVPPSFGANTTAYLAKALRENVETPALMQGHSFTFEVMLFIDENGKIQSTALQNPELKKDGKSAYYDANSAEMVAYNQWAWAIDKYLANLTGWKAGTIGGYARFSFIKIPVCIGVGCP